jgi:hypothetical protein
MTYTATGTLPNGLPSLAIVCPACGVEQDIEAPPADYPFELRCECANGDCRSRFVLPSAAAPPDGDSDVFVVDGATSSDLPAKETQ